MSLAKHQKVNVEVMYINAEQDIDGGWYDCGSYDLRFKGIVAEVIDDNNVLVKVADNSENEEVPEIISAVFTKEMRPLYNAYGTETGELQEDWWADIADGAQIVFE